MNRYSTILFVTVAFLATMVILALNGCATGPQIPIQGQPVTIHISAQACTAPAQGTADPVPTEGPQAVGTCSIAVWVDSPVGGASQDTQGWEAGDVGVEARTRVQTGESE